MEAKEIVAEEVARQAKFGYEPSWLDFVIAGQNAGRKEVVEFVNTNTTLDGYKHAHHALKARWEAKLEEWHLKEES